MKKAVVTTFPLSIYDTVAREMLRTFDQHWPADIDLFISLDCVSETEFNALHDDLNGLFGKSKREFFICNDWGQEQRDFYARNVDAPDVSYRFHVCKFSHKVFALMGAANHCVQTKHDVLIWLDADVITHKPITHEILESELLPQDGQIVSYLGRKDAPHSECGFVGYDLANGGHSFIQQMYDYYVTDKVLTLAGWTDCDVFDEALKHCKGRNLSEGLEGWHVWPASPLGKYTEHRKGARKFNDGAKIKKPSTNAGKSVDIGSMKIPTKNCVPNEQIQANIRENLTLIKHWVQHVKPHNEEVVIASAGASLSYADMKKWADKGVKIVCVKHAIDRLREWKIKPWACVLLDPRPHVEGFVKRPDPDVIYFVASMVDPSVVKTLLENECKVVGYHAFVNAGEDKLLAPGDLLVCGGSATATRSIGLLYECLGFKEFHCYGYDLCHYTRPDPNEKTPDGQPKYLEVTLSAKTWGNKEHKRTFWTEGQLLAQAQELHDLYKTGREFRINLYGQGIAAWQHSHWEQYRAWVSLHNERIEVKKLQSPALGEWEYGITGRINGATPTANANGAATTAA